MNSIFAVLVTIQMANVAVIDPNDVAYQKQPKPYYQKQLLEPYADSLKCQDAAAKYNTMAGRTIAGEPAGTKVMGAWCIVTSKK